MTTAVSNLPPLESGDRLTREEFHRRYSLRPDIKRAELVDGVVFVASPTSVDQHGEQHAFVMGWLVAYMHDRPLVGIGDNSTVLLGPSDEVQPDAFLYLRDAPGSRARFTERGFLIGAPELAVEVSASSASYDLHQKKESYRRAGVLEYIVWQVYERRIDWFVLRDGEYVPLVPDRRGVIESHVFPGLRLPVAAMLAGDMTTVLKAIRRPRKPRSGK